MSFLLSSGVFEPAIPDSGVTRWTLDNGDLSSGTFADVWGGNPLSISGGVSTGEPGLSPNYDSGESASFDGTDDMGENTSFSGLSFGNPFSVSFWVQFTDTARSNFCNLASSTFDFLIDVNRDGNDNTSAGDVNVRYYYSGNYLIWGSSGLSLDDGNPHLVTLAVNDANTGGVSAYVDGSDVTVIGVDHSISPNDSVDSVTVAEGGDFGESWYTGSADDIRIHSKDLSLSEHQNLYNTGSI